ATFPRCRVTCRAGSRRCRPDRTGRARSPCERPGATRSSPRTSTGSYLRRSGYLDADAFLEGQLGGTINGGVRVLASGAVRRLAGDGAALRPRGGRENTGADPCGGGGAAPRGAGR